MKSLTLLLISSLFIFSCQNKNEKLTKEDEDFVRTYADVLLVTANLEQVKSNFNSKEFNQAKSDSLKLVFSAHHINSEIFNKKVDQYLENPRLWQKVQERTYEILEQRRQ